MLSASLAIFLTKPAVFGRVAVGQPAESYTEVLFHGLRKPGHGLGLHVGIRKREIEPAHDLFADAREFVVGTVKILDYASSHRTPLFVRLSL